MNGYKVYYVSESEENIEKSKSISLINECINSNFSIEILNGMDDVIYLDSEGTGQNPKDDELVMLQLYDEENLLLIDCRSVNLLPFKNKLEKSMLVIHNAKNDIGFLFEKGIFPRRIFCTYLAEKLMSIGLKQGLSLEYLAEKYDNAQLKKENKGKIVYELSESGIEYCIEDVIHLPAIRRNQRNMIRSTNMEIACALEMRFCFALAYFERCGVRIDPDMWNEIIKENEAIVIANKEKLDKFVYENFPKDIKLCAIDMQGDLFEGFKESKKCFVKWNSQISVGQLRIKCDDKQKSELDKLMKEYNSSKDIHKIYGPIYLSFISNNDGRIHPRYNQITIEGRISCPQKGIGKSGYEIPMPSFINIPKTGSYRRAIIPDNGNVLICADWSSHEMMIMAKISGELDIIKAVNSGVWLYDYMFEQALSGKIQKELYDKLYPNRKDITLMICYMGTEYGMSEKFDISMDAAKKIISLYMNRFSKFANYKFRHTENIISRGVIPLNTMFGYKIYIEEIERLRRIRGYFSNKFWKNYAEIKKTMPDAPIIKDVAWFRSEKSRIQRLAIQGVFCNTGAIMFKLACVQLMNRIIENNDLDIVKLVIPQHDSITIECPLNMAEKYKAILVECMNSASSKILDGVVVPLKTWEGDCYR